MGKRLERFGEVRIADETNGFGLDFVKMTESGFWSATPIMDILTAMLHHVTLTLTLEYEYKKLG